MRQLTKERIDGLLSKAQENAAVMGEIWKLRENYRTFANTQNDTLKWILERSAAAVEKCLVEEDPVAAAAAAKAKGAKKK